MAHLTPTIKDISVVINVGNTDYLLGQNLKHPLERLDKQTREAKVKSLKLIYLLFQKHFTCTHFLKKYAAQLLPLQ